MKISLQITNGSNQPVYARLISQIENAIAKGELKAGDRLPPVRKLAMELTVNPNTVAKAYREMEQRNLVETRKGAGTFIAESYLREPNKEELEMLKDKMDAIIAHAMSFGLDIKQIEAEFKERLEKFINKGEEK